jgi:hypothetical protein
LPWLRGVWPLRLRAFTCPGLKAENHLVNCHMLAQNNEEQALILGRHLWCPLSFGPRGAMNNLQGRVRLEFRIYRIQFGLAECLTARGTFKTYFRSPACLWHLAMS